MGQNFQQHMNAGFQSFGQHIQNTMYQPMMTQLQNVHESFHLDIATLDSRFDDLSSSEQYEQLVERQQQLQQSFNTFNTTFTGFSDHFYSVYPAPVPPPKFYPHQPFYPPPPPPPLMWLMDLFGNWCQRGREIMEEWFRGSSYVYSLHWTMFNLCLNLMCWTSCIACLVSACMNLCVWTSTWLIICDELCWLAKLSIFRLFEFMWFWGCVNNVKLKFYIYISCVPRFPLVGETPLKF